MQAISQGLRVRATQQIGPVTPGSTGTVIGPYPIRRWRNFLAEVDHYLIAWDRGMSVAALPEEIAPLTTEH
jgi:hypothetical protein